MNYPVLGVNIDHVATIRQARGEAYPDIVEAALLAEQSDIFCITAHLREDRRHIQDQDIYRLKDSISTKLNMEMSLAQDVVEVALDVKPYMVTLVPENRQEITTEGGLNIRGNLERLQQVIPLFQEQAVIVSLFIEANAEDLMVVKELGAEYVEFHTGTYANAFNSASMDAELNRLYSAAEEAVRLGIKVNAGHGLTCENLDPILQMKELRELNIGHSIISRSLFIGLHNAVEEMLALIQC